MSDKVSKTDDEWRSQLTPEQYRIMREKGTERAFTGELLRVEDPGVFSCAGCGQALFDYDTKFESGSGWPSFWAPIEETAVAEAADNSHGMRRVEALCSRCDAHLGHVFDDGPQPTGQRYCINSASLQFTKRGGDG